MSTAYLKRLRGQVGSLAPPLDLTVKVHDKGSYVHVICGGNEGIYSKEEMVDLVHTLVRAQEIADRNRMGHAV